MHSVLLAVCCTLSGTVHAPSGAPIAQAQIVLRGVRSAETVTDAAGHFAVNVAPGSYELHAAARAYEPVTVARVAVNADTRIDVVLEPLDSPKLRTIGSVTVDGRLARISGVIPSVDVGERRWNSSAKIASCRRSRKFRRWTCSIRTTPVSAGSRRYRCAGQTRRRRW